ncbi:MAG: hypothetical protein GWN99_15620 [Gemmatimonadetes bacterium]|uniref:Uncharacterized protein n=1 Tax=Candidatus Kutchimonas denitrificans TaxID=3056748 RepID=A0AAE4Z568_9BACT|nr:hypothetical protein [Gemmatimonadota bacterium]NIR73733.1 hypothetical protein [Candidatus Kutchimonas denitrificans]NIS02473.1 hypothetical protein [Gemmatimonadota bacterium]NIT67463.1 hypothetical protein [Gemmatimonadota bacterium]NIU51595.1 hypothetical protein [Gemmatimonadota bacterium]
MWSYKKYKQSVAPIYKSETERRLFATASGDTGKKLKEELTKLMKLRERVLGRAKEEGEPEGE